MNLSFYIEQKVEKKCTILNSIFVGRFNSKTEGGLIREFVLHEY